MPNFPIEQYLESMKQRQPDAAYIAQALAGGIDSFSKARDDKRTMAASAAQKLIGAGYQPVVDGKPVPGDTLMQMITNGVSVPNMTWEKAPSQGYAWQKDVNGNDVLAPMTYGGLPVAAKDVKAPPKDATKTGKSLDQIRDEARARAEGAVSVAPQKAENEINKKELATMTNVLPKLDQAFKAVAQLEDLFYKGVNPASVGSGDIFGGLGSRIGGLVSRGSAAVGTAPNVNRYLANRKGFSGLIAKGGFGEAGMLTQQDIDRVVDLLPNPGSTKEESDIAFTEIKKILGAARERYELKYEQVTGKSYSSPTGKQEGIGNTKMPAVGETFTDEDEARYQELLKKAGK